MPQTTEVLAGKIRELSMCFQGAAKRLLDCPEFCQLWAEQQAKRPGHTLDLEVRSSETQKGFLAERDRMDQCFRPFAMLVEGAVGQSSVSNTLNEIKAEIKRTFPDFRIGLVVLSEPKAIPQPKSARAQLGVNDRKFLRSLRIAPDQPDQHI